jgi:hypothetical protein
MYMFETYLIYIAYILTIFQLLNYLMPEKESYASFVNHCTLDVEGRLVDGSRGKVYQLTLI